MTEPTLAEYAAYANGYKYGHKDGFIEGYKKGLKDSEDNEVFFRSQEEFARAEYIRELYENPFSSIE